MENNFELETNTVWSFPKRGKWATHNAKFRGNFSPYIPKNLILRYSQPNDLILDQFVGGGTTLIECKLNQRKAIGLDINPDFVKLTESKLDFEIANPLEIKVAIGNACNLNTINDESIDLICTHPPYANIIKYSKNIAGDLSLLHQKDFLIAMNEVAKESYRVIKNNKYCCIVMGDTRKNGKVQPLGFAVMQKFIKTGFKIKEIIIKEQHNCSADNFWKEKSQKYNFLLLAHEYIFVFVKE